MNFHASFNFYGTQNTLHFSFQTIELHDDLPRYDFQAGLCWFVSESFFKRYTLLRHLWDLLFREADIQSRLSGSWLDLQGGGRNKSPTWHWILTKPVTVDWLWLPLLRYVDKAKKLTDSISFLTLELLLASISFVGI